MLNAIGIADIIFMIQYLEKKIDEIISFILNYRLEFFRRKNIKSYGITAIEVHQIRFKLH